MPMTPFYTRFHNLAFKEMRVATIQEGTALPPGEYGFLELYCNEQTCDCRRVLINVVSETPTGLKTWATLNSQTPYAPHFLKLFEFVLEDEAYVARLKRHYQLFKADLRQGTAPKHTNRKRGRRPRK